MPNLKSQIESLLFVSGDALDVKKIKRLLQGTIAKRRSYSDSHILKETNDKISQRIPDTPQNFSSVSSIKSENFMTEHIQQQSLQDISEEDIKKSIDALVIDYQEKGIRVLYKDDQVQMVSAPENASLIAQFVKSHLSQELSQSALETLACIAYNEPISKSEIDELRGVNSIFALRSLSIRGLISKIKSKEKGMQGQEYYKITLDFLKKLGIEKTSDLPH